MGCFQQGHPGCSCREVTAIQRHNEHPFCIGFQKKAERKGCSFLELKRKHTAGKRATSYGNGTAALKGTAVGISATLSALMLSAVLIAGGILSEETMDVCTVSAMAFGAVSSVLGSALAGGRRGVGYGSLQGAGLLFVCAVSGFLLYRKIDLSACVLCAVVCIGCGAVTGILCDRKRNKRR